MSNLIMEEAITRPKERTEILNHHLYSPGENDLNMILKVQIHNIAHTHSIHM